ncbi:peptidoglycan-binding protein [Xanthomonas hortorum pv. vitians]|uniref:Peptidoglycan DD-metalloendopeptidase family protein n=1 Tax=Xanthomonas hortorum pv. vitians TaxID=83224 RepID=A0A6V7BGM0_9XANT|nr:peptidoglycan-binding protein [Xanthomonas hortorum]APP86344.1 lytic transglycosylase [Xanthomonas hortorum pv. gardneri]ASW47599.1 lytic transglycosylase [Xanthomonas hortorum]MCC8493485.1 peptidoglycan DD-metalloendopeptidase family protein [Xanthomonas hortorum pv. gardneri]MCE4283175.1 peptidoglycan DD-metalloendopeptidase family protein [Xanthomonas hortorum pv. vitians]MCE4286278.1 peptidoglycan DD-metalloendopeptidase family protein [Xanthomonas hortorum pv. vitians]
MTDNTIYTEMLQPRGAAYSSDRIKPWSHYREPIDSADGRLHGESRRWGDASPQTQSRVIDSLINASQDAGLSSRETAYVLAIARVESGFNPDAAAGTTSASGLGQFIDRTGAHYGVTTANRFDVQTQSQALVQHFIDNRDLARSRGQDEDYIYKYHHDGPSKDYGGLALSRREIAPHLDNYTQFVDQRLAQTQGNAVDRSAPAAHPAEPSHATRSNFQQTMERMLPGQGSTDPHITGHYGEHRGSRGPHGGTDFNYEGGQAGRNLQHPTVHSPVSGTVTFAGGNYGTVKIRDAQGNSHEILHLEGLKVKEGQALSAGDAIGTMGGRGPNGVNQYAQHVHYQLRDANGKLTSPETFWNQGHHQESGARQAQASTHAGNGTLRQGDHNPDVGKMQQDLNRLGVRDAQGNRLAEDGRFGDNTREAVVAFQKQHGLQPDGVVGRQTQAALSALPAQTQPHAGQTQQAAPKGPSLNDASHPDHALHTAIRGRLPSMISNETAAHVTLQAKQNGIDSADKLQDVTVQNGKAFVMGTTPGFRAAVDLNQPAPTLEQTSAQLLAGQTQRQTQDEQHKVAIGGR